MNSGMSEALELLRSVAKSAPENLETQREVFARMACAGHPRDALPYFLTIVRIQPEWSQFHLEAFHNCQQTAVVDALREVLRQESKVGKDAYTLWYALGLAAHSVSDLEEAVSAYTIGLEINPNYAPLHYNLGTAEYELRHIDRAKQHQQEALRLSPEFAEAHHALGMILLKLGESASGIQHLETYVRLNRPHLARYVASCRNFLKMMTGRVAPGTILSDREEYQKMREEDQNRKAIG